MQIKLIQHDGTVLTLSEECSARLAHYPICRYGGKWFHFNLFKFPTNPTFNEIVPFVVEDSDIEAS